MILYIEERAQVEDAKECLMGEREADKWRTDQGDIKRELENLTRV